MKIGEIEKIGIREPLVQPLPTFDPSRRDAPSPAQPEPSAPTPAPAPERVPERAPEREKEPV